ncbi:hypothetical protein Ga0609869_001540 [Rhodovulum iodosum]|uniref:Retropepsin-like aspartic endopeptidase domain-containing protein n=1 Tax=Rhodovulum iodosum TaxID=68291 RepID=A0ABV3XUV4_9RHOB|nr:RimK/LysX family protein [Rhodovulum robiginosum]RSK30516.1 ATP-dependent zinc protease [Rhodovulum robiginosum]
MNRKTAAAGKKTAHKRAKTPPLVIGWREIVDLPDLGLDRVKAKIDTGARTTALHAGDLRFYDAGGAQWVEFRPPDLGHVAPDLCRARVHDRRAIKNTSGVPEERVIIRTHLHIANRNFLIEVALANRGDMAFPIIIGRTAIRYHRLLVDSGRSWITRPKPLKRPKAKRSPS